MQGARASRQEERRVEILQAATDVFFRSGFSGASIDDVIAIIGGSKRTIYSYFGNKEQLFVAVIRNIINNAMKPLLEEVGVLGTMEAALHYFGLSYLKVIMAEDTLQLYRVVVSEGVRFPDLAQVFFEAGPGRTSARLAQTLRKNGSQWGIAHANHMRLAEHFVGMIRDDLHLKVVLGLHHPPTPEESEAAVRTAVEIFLHGVCGQERPL